MTSNDLFQIEQVVRKVIKEELESLQDTERERCSHVWKETRNGNTQIYFSGANAYKQCELCGKKEQI